jgi:prevent-host-death family protein
MSETSISVTDAARNFSDCINRVRYRGTSFILEKNGVPVARIVPVHANTGSGSEDELAEVSPQARQASREEHKPEAPTAIPIDTAEESNQNSEQLIHPKRPPFNW